jgi:phage shock protein C
MAAMDDRLYRSSTDRMLAGVAGGLAERMAVDPSLVRIGWVLLAIFSGGIFALIYLVMAVVVPERPVGMAAPGAAAGQGATPPSARPEPGTWIGPDGEPVAQAADMPTDRPAAPRRPGATAIVAGGILILIGAWVLVTRWVPDLDTGMLWPIVAIVLGAALVVFAFIRPAGR